MPLARVLAALLLMGAALALIGTERLGAQLRSVVPVLFAAAVLAAALAQALSVWRWSRIARIFGLHVHLPALALGYAQGMTLNALLPGATLSGDALRSVRLQALGNPLGVSALTVLLDRLSGLWILCVLSLLTGLGLALRLAAGTPLPPSPALAAAGLDVETVFVLYLLGLALLCGLPFAPFRAQETAPGTVAHAPRPALPARVWNRIAQLHALTLAQRVPLARSLWSSVLVQVLSAACLWFCVLAAGGHAAYWQVQAVAAPVFVAGALPLSYGGFGARELTALLAFPLVGLPAELGLAAAVLYGIVALILGVLAAPSFALRTATGAARPQAS